MAEFAPGSKRKFEGAQNQSPKRFHKNNSHPHPRTHSYSSSRPREALQPSSHGLPSLPEVQESYQSTIFTHPTQAPHDPQGSYDRLEFLGDAYMELYASQLIFDRFSASLEAGRLSQIRETLVKNETIGQYATLYGLDKQLKNYKQFQNGPPSVWLKIKGDIFEAYVAAVVLSSPDGPEIAKAWLHQLWEPKLVAAATSTQLPSKRSKEELAKKILMKGVKINYVDEKPPVIHYGKGTEEYFVGVYFNGWDWENQHLGSGKGLSRVEAGLVAATNALQNHPLIDQIGAKKSQILAEREMAAPNGQATQ